MNSHRQTDYSSLETLRRVALLPFFLLLLACPASVPAQKVSGFDKERGQLMLRMVKEDLKKNYYDAQYRGMDLDARFKAAEDKIKEATSIGQIFGIIAQTLLDLNDSHTFFVPPALASRFEYGWQVEMVGEVAYVVAVKPESDAEVKGLSPGDRVVGVDGVALTRKNLWIFKYLYNALRPQPGMRLLVIKPDGKQEQLDAMARVVQGKRVVNLTGSDGGVDLYDLIRGSENASRLRWHRFQQLGGLVIWKMPTFSFVPEQVDSLMAEHVKGRNGLILDLRGNGGGYVDTLLRLLGTLFDHDVKVSDLKSRKEQKPMIAKTRGSNLFSGKLVVLIDSESGSASELFARIVQLEKRGTVIGDTSAGAVMQSKPYGHQLGIDTVVPFSVSITDADFIMTDGKSLEGVGVIPDEIKLPTAADLAAKRDPVLAYAASLLGVSITAEKAGGFFPIEWKK